MSINSMQKKYKLYELVDSAINNSWETDNEKVETYIKDVEVTINYATGNFIRATDNAYSEVTHIGLTRDRTLKQGQILVLDNHRYIIHIPPNNITRMTQLYLKEVID